MYEVWLCAVSDVVVKFVVRHALTHGSELNPKAIEREGTVIVVFGEVVQQLR